MAHNKDNSGYLAFCCECPLSLLLIRYSSLAQLSAETPSPNTIALRKSVLWIGAARFGMQWLQAVAKLDFPGDRDALTKCSHVAGTMATSATGKETPMFTIGDVLNHKQQLAGISSEPVPPRTIAAIAREIRHDWANVYFGAVPYLEAMRDLGSINDAYGHDSADSIVRYFLSNARNWRGPVAKRIKAELLAMLKRK